MYKQFGKRLVDIFLAVFAVMLLSPLMLFVALLIKFFDPGPIFFKQIRIGKDGNLFLFYKFRSMPVTTGNLPSDKIGSIKLTWIGKFIRRTNIDELPQLLNILIGDMSIVGPRPPIPSQAELLEFRKINESIKCRPGLTGLAQINSFDGMTVAQKASYDGEYAQSVSFWMDIKIIVRTFCYLLNPPPVY